jgi:hypothetical protein
MKMSKFKWWMTWHVAIWGVISPKRVKIYHYGLAQGFSPASSYWSARTAKSEIIDFIIGK